jgi:TonB family protein
MKMFSNAFLLDTVSKASLILGLAWLLTLALHRASAAVRYLVWTCTLAAILTLPPCSWLLPRWSVHLKMPAAQAIAYAVPVAQPASVSITVHATHAPSWPAWIWLAGFLAVLFRLAAGHWRLTRLRRRAQRIGTDPAAALWSSTETDVPLTCGLLRASVILPHAWDEWDDERRQIVLMHERTHVRRRDPLLWFIAQIAAAVYWFHPLAWLAVARLRREQERSCDDAVVRAGAACSEYARHLVDLARALAPAGAYAAALGMAMTSDLEQRVRALLDPRRKRHGLTRAVCLVCGTAALAAVIPLAALHAQQSSAPASLYGTVRDPSGAVVPNALILLNSNGHQEAARTGAAGDYKFVVPDGSYAMEVKAPGFAEFRKPVVLPADSQTNITLDVGAVNEAVEIVGKAPAPQVTGTPHRIKVGGMVQATKLVSMIKPLYPPDAEAAGVEGTVLLRAVISATGDLLGLSAVNRSVDARLINAAMDAVKQWHYEPTLLNGEPVEVVTTIEITFRLE